MRTGILARTAAVSTAALLVLTACGGSEDEGTAAGDGGGVADTPCDEPGSSRSRPDNGPGDPCATPVSGSYLPPTDRSPARAYRCTTDTTVGVV